MCSSICEAAVYKILVSFMEQVAHQLTSYNEVCVCIVSGVLVQKYCQGTDLWQGVKFANKNLSIPYLVLKYYNIV